MFYDNYVRLCNFAGKTPSAVATEIGIQKSTVSRWSKGSTPNHATAIKVADYFSVPVEDLLHSNISSQPYKLMENIDLQLFGEQKKEPIVINDELSDSKRKFIERVMQMSDEELDRLDQILRLVEGTK